MRLLIEAFGILIVTALTWGVFGARMAAAEEGSTLAVIVAKSWSDVNEIDAKVLKRIYLGKTSSLSGAKVVPVHFAIGSPLRKTFVDGVLRRSESKLAEHWIQEALSGGAKPPQKVDSFEEMVSVVSGKPGVIGYVDASRLASESPSGVKKVAELSM